MTRARDKASAVVANFASTGIDDNASATAVTVDSSGNVGVGGTPNSYGGYTALTLNHATAGGILDFEHNGTLVGELFLTDVNTFSLQAAGAKNINFKTNTAERFRITDNGVTFNGDTAAANALDDYEEGTFTPSIGGSGVGYGTASGSYRKIGKFVFIYLQISITTIGTPATTNSIQGLPFAPALSNQHFGVAYYDGITNNTYELHGNFRSDSTIRMEGKTSFGGGQNSGHGWAQNGAAIYGSGSYYTS